MNPNLKPVDEPVASLFSVVIVSKVVSDSLGKGSAASHGSPSVPGKQRVAWQTSLWAV